MLDRLRPQMRRGVGVLTLADGGEWSIGAKRQALLLQSTAEYVSYVDDDDDVSPQFVAEVLKALRRGPDVVGFRLRYVRDGEWCGEAVHSYNAASVVLPPMPRGVKRMERKPNHLNPVRRELALRVGFKPINHGEDAAYAEGLAELNPREAFIDAELYTYLYRTNRRGEVTNESLAERRR